MRCAVAERAGVKSGKVLLLCKQLEDGAAALAMWA